jgi:phosphoribosylformylglycinamidine cyclo-ligase
MDLVNHCVNDILVQGAEPLFFLDYLATGRLSPAVAESIVTGMANACRENGCALLGGETAEMPGFYQDGEYDIAGFIVGVVDRPRLINGRGVAAGDVLVGLPSSGLHTNGYSLARKIVFEHLGLNVDSHVGELGRTVGEALLEPHRSYLPYIRPLLDSARIKAMAHITGGGLLENIPRVLPQGLHARIDAGAWPQPRLMAFLQGQGNIEPEEMARTFNCGIGMAVIVSQENTNDVLQSLEEQGEKAFPIGRVEVGVKGCTVAGPAGSWSARGDWTATHHG